MSADSRTVTTDALETLGSIITDAEKRDAIHLAVEPAIAGERLAAGDHVTLKDGRAVKAPTGFGLGIVDPFLTAAVRPDQRFWLVVYPRKISSLRHVWEHPAFPPSGETGAATPAKPDSASLVFLHNMAAEAGISYGRLMDGAEEYLESGEYIIGREHMEGSYAGDEFWEHYQRVTGKVIPSEKQGNFLSCSC